jgi:hypothetical protein
MPKNTIAAIYQPLMPEGFLSSTKNYFKNPAIPSVPGNTYPPKAVKKITKNGITLATLAYQHYQNQLLTKMQSFTFYENQAFFGNTCLSPTQLAEQHLFPRAEKKS